MTRPEGRTTGVGLRPETSLAEAFQLLRQRFREAGLDSSAREARLCIQESLGISPIASLTGGARPLGPEGAAKLQDAARRRLAGEPLARIFGWQEFWGLPFALSPETLVPRPDSETVVETALALVGDRQRPCRILDLGTGSGCLLVALLHELVNASGLGIDRHPAALVTARDNAVRNHCGSRAAFAASDWAEAVDGTFDLIVSNPPYIASGSIGGLAPEVRDHDPRPALDGGPDGLHAYRVIFGEAPRLLGRESHLVVEIGFDQESAVRALSWRAGLMVDRVAADLAGHSRAVAVSPRRQRSGS